MSDFQALLNEFNDNWSNAISTTYDNFDFEPVNDEPFVRFSIRQSGKASKAFGNSLQEAQGRVWLQIFIPQGQGQALAHELADDFEEIFKVGKRLDAGAITCHEAYRSTTGVQDGFYSVNSSVRWTSLRRT